MRLIDSGLLISKPLSSLRVTPEKAGCPAMTTYAHIAGIIPTGGSSSWGLTAKDTIKELLEGCENCKVIPKVGWQEICILPLVLAGWRFPSINCIYFAVLI